MLPNPDALQFYAAYQQHGEVKKYLGDGAGHIRLFKDRDLLENYLAHYLTPDDLALTVVHSVDGLIAVPEPDNTGSALVPISTLALEAGAPSEVELLVERVKRHRHKAKGAR